MNITSRNNILYSKGGGHYMPAFFKLAIFNDADFSKINEWDEISVALFFHEYIHFLQDISTIYGLNNIIRIGEIIQEAIAGFKSGNANFETPLVFCQGNVNTKDIDVVLGGDRGEIDLEIVINGVELVSTFPVNNTSTYFVPKVIIDYNEGNKINFGSHAIMESMAYIAEQYVSRNELKAAQYPYHMAKMVVDFQCPGFSVDILNVYVLCDLSLMHSEPGSAFIKYLAKITESGHQFSSPEEIYEFFDDEKFTIDDHLDDFKEKKLSRLELYLNLASRALFYISGYFQHIEQHPNIEYLKHQLNVVAGYRKYDPNFMLNILKEKKFYGNKQLMKLLSLLGSPLLVDLSGNTFFLPPINTDIESDMEIPWLMTQFLSDISGNSSICKALAVCRRVEDRFPLGEYTNENCYEKPWKRAQQLPQCSYGKLLTLWGINVKNVK